MSPHHVPSLHPDSKISQYFLLSPQAPDDLIIGALEIFDRKKIEGALHAAWDHASSAPERRKATVEILKDALKEGRRKIESAVLERPHIARPALRAYCYLTDCIVLSALNFTITKIHHEGAEENIESFSVLAVGGYGRGEMSPHSDVDLLFLTSNGISEWTKNVVETTLYLLWDLRLKVGHSLRNLDDCIRLGEEDYTIRTALLEIRPIAGNEELANHLHERLRNELFSGTAHEFIDAKLAERTKRHDKQGGQRYVVEPNVKEGKGGLRDLHTLYWIAKYVHGVRAISELVKADVFSTREFEQFEKAETYLHKVRNIIHLITNRPMDQLTFDLQVEVAEKLGYHDKAGRRGVEYFMQDYFRHATHVGELTRIFLVSLEAQMMKPEPKLQNLFKRRIKIPEQYNRLHNRIDIKDPESFFDDKLNILRIFQFVLKSGHLLHPEALRHIANNIHLIDQDFINDPEARRLFISLLIKHGNPERALRRMNEIGVLGAFIPEFNHIVAMMQFNMYHSYTVDEHTIQVIKNLAQIEREELVEELPLASSILKEGINRKVIYIACLLHDIGKGRDGDHSIIGAQLTRKIAPRLGLKPEECETIEWLVRYHLLMSDMAQKRDLSDPRTVRDFAKAVKTKERLDLLTVLTVCDIRGVGPNTWNNWKAVLIRNLHEQTSLALEHGLEAINKDQRAQDAKKHLRNALSDWPADQRKQELARHYNGYWQGLSSQTHLIFARLLKEGDADKIGMDFAQDFHRDATQMCFAMPDHPGIFSRLAGALALVGANVVDARTYTTKDGFVAATFWVQDGDGHPYDSMRLPRLEKMIHETLSGKIKAQEAFKSRDKIKKRESKFRVPTSITFDNEGSEIFTIIEVDTRDRPGLLYDLTRELNYNNISIATAQIATYGEQAVDVFYVKDMFGMKLHSEHKRNTLEKKLREAISRVTQRSLS